LVHGNVYKVPDIPESTLDRLANVFLIDTDIKDIPPASQKQARNMTASIYVVQQEDVNVTIAFTNDRVVDPQGSGGAVNAVSIRNIINTSWISMMETVAEYRVGWWWADDSGSGHDD